MNEKLSHPTGRLYSNSPNQGFGNLPKVIQPDNKGNNAAEGILSIIATIILWLGILVAIVFLLKGISCLDRYSKEELGYALIEKALYLFFSSITIWGVLKVLCNISNNLHEINSKTKK